MTIYLIVILTFNMAIVRVCCRNATIMKNFWVLNNWCYLRNTWILKREKMFLLRTHFIFCTWKVAIQYNHNNLKVISYKDPMGKKIIRKKIIKRKFAFSCHFVSIANDQKYYTFTIGKKLRKPLKFWKQKTWNLS